MESRPQDPRHPRPMEACLVVLLLLLSFPPGLAGADVIADFVEQVEDTRLSGHIEALEFPRSTPQALALASDYISGQLETFGYTVVHQPVQYSENLIARLEGTVEPEHVFVIGAHYDTVANSPGADDNASGVAAVLEIARILAGASLPYSIEFVAFTLEELWMVGSFEYMAQAMNQGMDIFGMIDFDMIGYTCATPYCQHPYWSLPGCLEVDPEGVTVGTYVALLVNTASASLLQTGMTALTGYVPRLMPVTMQVAGVGGCFPFTRRSDHVPFWDAGIQAIEFLDTYGDRNPYYHTPNDLLATLDIPFCRKVTQTAVAMALMCGGISGLPAPAEAPLAASLGGVSPNPFDGYTRVRFELPEPTWIKLSVHDVSGRLLQILTEGAWAAGDHQMRWDGTNALGRPVGRGVYLVRLETPRGFDSRRVIRIR